MKKSVTISFLGNLYYDTRTTNMFRSLSNSGHDVDFYGFDWLSDASEKKKHSQIHITYLRKSNALFFYLTFAIRLLLKLLFKKSDMYIAADFFSLPVTFFIAKLKRAKVFYDARDLYTQLPGSEKKRFEPIIIKWIEGFCARRVDHIFVTGKMDGDILKQLYNITNISLLRNVPLPKNNCNSVDLYERYSIPKNKKILLYQGKIVKERGIEEYLEVIRQSEQFVLLLLGDGEDMDYYRTNTKKMGIEQKIFFGGKIPQETLHLYTAGCFAGLSIIKNDSMNSYLALPNKLFEYIMVGLPVIVSDLPQMKNIIETYHVGAVIKQEDVAEVISTLEMWRNEPEKYEKLKVNCLEASKTLNWDTEFKNIYGFFE